MTDNLPYDQRSLEAGLNVGIVVGILLAMATAGYVWLAHDIYHGIKDRKTSKK